MQELKVISGSEFHTPRRTYGKVLIDSTGTGEFVHHYKTNRSEADWDEVIEVGNHGKHGRWVPALIQVEEGELVYIEGASTYRGHAHQKGRGWFRASEDASEVKISTPGYSDNSVEVRGRLKRLSYQEMKTLGLSPTIRSSKHLSVEEV